MERICFVVIIEKERLRTIGTGWRQSQPMKTGVVRPSNMISFTGGAVNLVREAFSLLQCMLPSKRYFNDGAEAINPRV
jgi:hypothetical protein